MTYACIRIAYLALALSFYLLGYWHESMGNSYDALLFHNYPNAITVIICSALMGAAYSEHRNTNVVGVTIGLIIYEVMQLWIPARTFDWLDIMASIVGMVLYLTAFQLVFKRLVRRKVRCKQSNTAT
ncbi:hypothetical protein [Alteromonas gilva]|uniref:VanZ-like domain-containing protein n=1 Tax=Alteromonas gilva TaxID=2987522 RepID=A0ABT5L7K5_9ALTE|nr:hypothetical protein [Alteromonas gilva]MDC8833024.1 hypothetical protein [Alteromonas gilva]